MDLGTRSLTLSLGGDDQTVQVSNCRIVSGAADSDFVSFADAAAGGAREYRLQGTAKQSTDADTIHDLIWTAAGTTIAAVVKPNGGVAATANTPTYSGNVVISEPDGDILGGEANASPTAKFTIDFDFAFTAKPVKAVA
jgi:hypothetical protein